MEMNSSCSMKRALLLVAVAIGLYFMKPAEGTRTIMIIDITHTYYNVIPIFNNPNGSKPIIHDQDRDGFQTGYYTVGTHFGTHVDTPQHLMSLIDNPISVPTLDLQTLIG
ncbi:OLC1v1005734C1 [Oldenlandia corymbosa var. corymbosa]|uniref:OLC1v1005734C1 n=1 Tax=Oldenlandia corymbosa var. corymbosa TaxID=529605 RepID=A0AAV1DFL6_OLDCO|nr:OLC1v1005734C1 [Oldenlandia corymbosa var. corymbosa]